MKVIAGYRVMMGLTQKEMARYLGISRQAYSEKERGNVPFNDNEKISLRNLFREVDADLSIDRLFFLSFR